ncbi:hypothetical protein [Flavobacterium sp. NRK F7]|uniref:hypothetical protein n=1 Tax=Flavobacterium sp. NRK F7 TaxID=2954930 RepID=UPI002091E04A|nr:hypothetical protein [Flavobacterium sp. NRK F7]MCO6162461.1 hypothetical protein [Flavobacterium sp. NRK F7]
MNFKNIIVTFSLICSLFVVTSCSEDEKEDFNYISFEKKTINFGVALNDTDSFDVKVYASNTTGESRTFSVDVVEAETTADPQYYSVPATFTIPGNANEGVIPVTVTGTNLGSGVKIVLRLTPSTSVYTNSNATASSDKVTINVTEACFQNPVNLAFTFDSYPEETYWELYQGATLYASSAAGDYTGQSTFSQLFCLPDGDYTLVVYDDYGDGISSPGGFMLTSGTTTLASGGGNFGTEVSYNFTL